MDDKKHCEQGLMYSSKGLYEMAISQFTKAIEINPSCHEAYKNRGLIYCLYIEEFHEEAVCDFTKAIEFCPDDPVSYHGRGLIYYAQGRYDQALEDFSRVLELHPGWGGSLYRTRGEIYLNGGRFLEAANDFTRAMEFDPEYAENYRNRALAWYHLKEYRKALVDSRSFLKLGGEIDCIEIDPAFLTSLQANIEGDSAKPSKSSTASILAFPSLNVRKSAGGG
jgi:tetratricopeptide (TPR) repeat protein